jgi:hypothetical protein
MEEGVDERKRSHPLAVEAEAGILVGWDLRAAHVVAIINDNTIFVNQQPMAARRSEDIARQARKRIAQIRAALSQIDYLCSGTLLERMKKCGRPGCVCARDPAARHGPYIEWGHMRDGKLVHRLVSTEYAAVLRRAIANYREVKKLLRDWEAETERLIDAEQSAKT